MRARSLIYLEAEDYIISRIRKTARDMVTPKNSVPSYLIPHEPHIWVRQQGYKSNTLLNTDWSCALLFNFNLVSKPSTCNSKSFIMSFHSEEKKTFLCGSYLMLGNIVHKENTNMLLQQLTHAGKSTGKHHRDVLREALSWDVNTCSQQRVSTGAYCLLAQPKADPA